ncbi:MAG: sirohydrochlorin cobaltochelatase [Desulfobulbaceae bacterium]|nr:sirohydrochlorin cobaltochelatase [Desulfobulbaceae bacterium]
MQIEAELKNAVVLAMFGTSVEHALAGLLNIRDRMVGRFPETPVHIAFTSNIIRRVWQERAKDPEYVLSHPEIPNDILNVRGPLAAIADLQDAGFDSIVVQAVHIAPAEEYVDLCAHVAGLNSIKTIKSNSGLFRNLVVGRPALGTFDTRYPYTADIKTAARSLFSDAALARQEGAALVYLGHGNSYVPARNIYVEFAAEMRRQYPDTPIVMTTLEGIPSYDEAIAELQGHNLRKVLLKPFLIAAGGHVAKDMMGDQPESLKNRLEHAGFAVHPLLKGLGEQDDFAQIFVQHAADAANDAAIELR